MLDYQLLISDSEYTRPVDKKKLMFILRAVKQYSTAKGKNIEELNILEAGCGQGAITLSLASLGCKMVAFDVDGKSVKYLQNRLIERGLTNVHTLIADGTFFCDNNQYDIIIASEVFEHVLGPEQLALNLQKRMSKEAYLIVTTPNGYGPWELKNRLSRNYLRKWNLLRQLLNKPPYGYSGNTQEHCQFYRRGDLLRMFARISLELIEFEKSDSILAALPSDFYNSNDWIGSLDMKLADILPCWLASGWYFVCKKKSDV